MKKKLLFFLYIILGSIAIIAGGVLLIQEFFIRLKDPMQNIGIALLIGLLAFIGICFFTVARDMLKRKKAQESGAPFCEICYKPVLTKDAYTAELNKMGFSVDSDGISMGDDSWGIGLAADPQGITMFKGKLHINVADLSEVNRSKIEKLDERKAMQCISCGRIECFGCISKNSPEYRKCRCGGAYNEI